jgi:hypothetical protein
LKNVQKLHSISDTEIFRVSKSENENMGSCLKTEENAVSRKRVLF